MFARHSAVGCSTVWHGVVEQYEVEVICRK